MDYCPAGFAHYKATVLEREKKIHKPFHKTGCILRHSPYKLPKRLESNTKNKKEEKNELAPHYFFFLCVPNKSTMKAKPNFRVG